MDDLFSSETFLSTPLLISPDLQDELPFKDSSSCRSGEISSGVDRNVSEENR
jgi:hypothetical protein